METTINIPQQANVQTVNQIRITGNETNRNSITVIIDDQLRGQLRQTIDITDEWNSASDIQKNVIKSFFKTIIAKAFNAVNVDSSLGAEDITGDLFIDSSINEQ